MLLTNTWMASCRLTLTWVVCGWMLHLDGRGFYFDVP